MNLHETATIAGLDDSNLHTKESMVSNQSELEEIVNIPHSKNRQSITTLYRAVSPDEYIS